MSYFDKKTDVIKIELTSYGKMLLAKGKFKPVYYDFFDNDIIYDGQHAGLEETRNDIQDRIKNETPYSKPQYNFSGVETKIKRLKELKKEYQEASDFSANKNNTVIYLQGVEEKNNFSIYPIGTSKLNTELPAISLYAGDTHISSSSEYSDLNGYYIHIPQINMHDSEYKARPRMKDVVDIETNENVVSNVFPDNQSYLEFEEQTILLNFDETNVRDLINNFEIEIFEVTSSKGKELYLPLYFTGIENNIDINSVENYFQISIDSEIDSKSIEKIDIPKKQSNLSPRII